MVSFFKSGTTHDSVTTPSNATSVIAVILKDANKLTVAVIFHQYLYYFDIFLFAEAHLLY
jgi:hypothetical protein